jgi:hypothetical protein
MTNEDIIRMAREAGLYVDEDGEILEGDGWHTQTIFIERFAELIAAAERNRTWTQNHWTEYERSIAATEREACANLCEDLDDGDYAGGDQPYGIHYARAIRKRGQQ